MSDKIDVAEVSPRRDAAIPPAQSPYRRARRAAYELFFTAEQESRLEYWIRMGIAGLIVLNIIVVILESVAEIEARLGGLFHAIEVFSVIAFSLEYILRLWAAVEDERFRHPVFGRLRYVFTFFALVDLAAIAPFLLPMVTTVDLRFIRGLRLLRLMRVLKLGRYSRSFAMLGHAIRSKREEMLVSLFVLMLILLISSSLMYIIEHEAQPDAFPNIPAALWWGVATLTTVGYGDIYPITPVGKLCAAVIAILGIGLVALPSGILVAGLIEELHVQSEPKKCPHCGKPL